MTESTTTEWSKEDEIFFDDAMGHLRGRNGHANALLIELTKLLIQERKLQQEENDKASAELSAKNDQLRQGMSALLSNGHKTTTA